MIYIKNKFHCLYTKIKIVFCPKKTLTKSYLNKARPKLLSEYDSSLILTLEYKNGYILNVLVTS